MKKFTDRFLELPKVEFDPEEDVSIIKTVSLDIYQISGYEPYMDQDLSAPEGVMVMMRGGEVHYIPMTKEKFEEEVNMHHAILCHV